MSGEFDFGSGSPAAIFGGGSETEFGDQAEVASRNNTEESFNESYENSSNTYENSGNTYQNSGNEDSYNGSENFNNTYGDQAEVNSRNDYSEDNDGLEINILS